MNGSETVARFRDLLRGPWISGGWRAFKYLRASCDLTLIARSDKIIRLKDISTHLSRDDALREYHIRSLLRPHWERPIRDPNEILYRDSLDHILETLALIELALETGYFDEAAVKRPVRRIMVDLLWSQGAREFVTSYGYISVIFLASRMGLDFGVLLDTHSLPTFTRAETRFAVFLAQHQNWYSHPELGIWLRFLDDYRLYPGEQEDFLTFLRDGNPDMFADKQHRFISLMAGLEQFCTYLSDLIDLLPKNEWPYFGMVYLYMMARFVGHRMTASGLDRDANDIDWASELRSSPYLSGAEDIGPKQLLSALDRLSHFWRVTSEFVAGFKLENNLGPAQIEIGLEMLNGSNNERSIHADELANALLKSVPFLNISPLTESWHGRGINTGLRIRMATDQLLETIRCIDEWRRSKLGIIMRFSNEDNSKSIIADGLTTNLSQLLQDLAGP
jgi:hypothetical protein